MLRQYADTDKLTYGTRQMLGAVDTDMGRQEIGQEGSTVWGPSLSLGGICFTTVTKFICTKAKQKQ